MLFARIEETKNHARSSSYSPDSFHLKICVRRRVVPLQAQILTVSRREWQHSRGAGSLPCDGPSQILVRGGSRFDANCNTHRYFHPNRSTFS